MKNKAIFLFDYTGLMALPWLENGYECWSFDGQHPPGITVDGLHMKVGRWFHPDDIRGQALEVVQMVGGNVQLVFGFPECTDLASSGAKHWAKKRMADPDFQKKAVNLALLVEMIGMQYGTPWAFENPVGAMSTWYRLPDFSFDPCHYGGYITDEHDRHPLYPHVYPPHDAYKKRTCIWCGCGFVVPEKIPVKPLDKSNPGWLKCGGKSKRTKNIRSATPRGFAIAVFNANAGHGIQQRQ